VGWQVTVTQAADLPPRSLQHHAHVQVGPTQPACVPQGAVGVLSDSPHPPLSVGATQECSARCLQLPLVCITTCLRRPFYQAFRAILVPWC